MLVRTAVAVSVTGHMVAAGTDNCLILLQSHLSWPWSFTRATHSFIPKDSEPSITCLDWIAVAP